MNHMMKRCLVLLLTAVMLLSICACTKPEQETEPTVDTAALAEAARNTVAITIGQQEINAVELNYYYVETINSFCNQYYYYIYYGMIDGNKPLNEQKCMMDETKTWAQYFLDMATDNMKSTYLLCQLANENNFTLPEEQRANLDDLQITIESYATQNQFANAQAYLEDIFGYGADMDSYMAYYERLMLADAYYSEYAESLEYTDADLREFETGHETDYNAYSYAVYTLSVSKFLTGGTEGSDGKVTYTDEQKAAALEAATQAANALKGSSCADLNAFKDLILGMDIHASLDSVSVTENNDVMSSSMDSAYKDWLISADRSFGDVTVVEKKTTGSDDKETVDAFYIVWYAGCDDNNFALKDVRHLLVMFKNKDGKTYADGIKTFTDEEKAATMKDMQAIITLWENGEKTEDAFAALANTHSQDGDGTTGGLYTDIYPGQMVSSFEKWCYDENRVVGDYEVVETEYGYHLMYFVGDSDITYRDYMITYNLRKQDLTQWHEDVMKSAEAKQVCLDYCDLDMLLFG